MARRGEFRVSASREETRAGSGNENGEPWGLRGLYGLKARRRALLQAQRFDQCGHALDIPLQIVRKFAG